MSKQHSYVLGLNTYDHDVSACLLRDGAIAFAVAKERITREKHASGFYKEVIDYCRNAEGITLDDVDLIVRNCCILPVNEMEERLVYQDMPGFLPDYERAEAAKHPLYRSRSGKVVSISHHLAHAYSAFAVSPFEQGVVMIVDGVGSYRSDVVEPYPPADTATPLARESESYYRFAGSAIECLKKVWMEPDRGFLSAEFYSMPGLGALYSRASTYIFGDWNKCGELMGLAPYGRREQVKHLLELTDGKLHVPDRSRANQSGAVSAAAGVRGADRRSRADQYVIQRQGRADRGDATRRVVCFLTTGIDHLVIHDTLISKNALHGIIGPLVGVYGDVASMVMASAPPA
jgi:carbamoyltransferase